MTVASAGDWGIVAILVVGIASWWGFVAYWIFRHGVRLVDVEFPYDKPPDEALRDWAGYYTGWLASSGYVMVAEGLGTVTYSRRYAPRWAIGVALIFFPIGLLALLAREEATLVVRAVPSSGRIHVDVGGYVHRDVAKELERDAAAASVPGGSN